MPYIRVWIHAVWSTKNREPYLQKAVRPIVFTHIAENAKLKGIYLDCVNGHTDHAHCLISLGGSQTIAKTIQLIKGESSLWINKSNLIKESFEWQDEYFAVLVSESQINAVRKYIDNQEAHHQKITFEQEYQEFISKYGFKLMK